MKIRTRIFLVFMLVVGAGFYALVDWIQGDLRPRYMESLEEPLIDTANLLAEMFADEITEDGLQAERIRALFARAHNRDLGARIYGLNKDRVDMRVYVTDSQGIVIFDSDNRRDEGQDYSRWNDVYRTLRGEYGARTTHGDPLHPEGSVLYIAAPLEVRGELVGVVSVGKPALNVDRFVEAAKRKVSIAGLIAAVVALALGLVLYAWVSLPLERLGRYARTVQAGGRAPLPDLGHNEIGMMGAAMEEMRTALAGKEYVEDYVQTLTHELKSPLAAIRGAAELLEEDMPPEQRQRFLSNIRTEGRRIQDLVDRMLELAALEKRQTLEQVEVLRLKALVEDVVDSLAPQLTVADVEVQSRIADTVQIRGERFLLRQAIANLVRNALEFSPAGGQITVAAELNRNNVVVTVSDNGPGVPEYARDKVLKRFYSLPRPGDGVKSTGLGLSLVKEVADLHGGQVNLENAPGGGALASLVLPV